MHKIVKQVQKIPTHCQIHGLHGHPRPQHQRRQQHQQQQQRQPQPTQLAPAIQQVAYGTHRACKAICNK
jgi:hypothetical protein